MNDSKVARSIRPYLDRSVLVTVQPSEIAEIDLKRTGWDVKKNPVAYFRMLGFAFAPKNSPKPQTSPAIPQGAPDPTPAPAPAPDANAHEPAVAPTEPVKTPKAVTDAQGVKISAEKGNVKHFHPGNKMWHVIRNVKEWAIGKVIYSDETKAYYKVNSLDGDLMVCLPLTREEALKITGAEAA